MANAQTLANVLGAFGSFAGGLSEGIETGVALTQRQQALELQKRQSNLQSLDAIAKAMEPGLDPAIREFTLANIMPTLGLKPEDAKRMTKLANSLDDQSRAYFTDFIKNNPDIASGKIPPEALMQQFMRDPLKAMDTINDWVTNKEQLKIQKSQAEIQTKRLDLDITQTEHSMRQDEIRTGIQAKGLELEEGRLNLAMQQAEAAVLDKMIDNRRQAITALTNAASIENDKVRGIVAKRISDEFNLGLTDQDIAGFEASANTLETLLDKAKLEETLLDIDQKKSGVNMPTSARKMYLDVRSKGGTLDSMPPDIKKMEPEQAKSALDALSTSNMTVTKGSLENKGSRDKARVDIADIEVAQNMNSRLMDIIQKNPEAAGALGSVARFSRRVTGAASSLDALIPGAKAEIGELVATADPATKSVVARILTNPNISNAEVFETALRLRYARTLSDSARINKDQYDVAADQIRITGLRDQEMVLEKLMAVQEVLETFKQGKKQLLDEDKLGIASEEDIQDDEDYGTFLDEINPDGEEEE